MDDVTDVEKRPENDEKDCAPAQGPCSSKKPIGVIKGKASVGSVKVSGRQKGNPMLRFIRNVRWEFSDIKADFVLGESTCALYLSLRFHKLHPTYIHQRIRELGKKYALRVLLVLVDIKEPENILRQLNATCFADGWLLMLGWSVEEIAELVEAYKIYENKPAEFLMDKSDANDLATRAMNLLKCIKPLNSSDAKALIEIFGSLRGIAEASADELNLCPGVGGTKVKRLMQVLDRPIIDIITGLRSEYGNPVAEMNEDDDVNET